MSDKHPFEAVKAMPVAQAFLDLLSPYSAPDRCMIVGSLRRRKQWVGDIEIVYVPRFRLVTADLFKPSASKMENTADKVLDAMLGQGLIVKRPNCDGSPCWGDSNKYAVHRATGLAVDFFATTEDCWWNAVVTRTGGKQNNINISSAAIRLGWNYEACGRGFVSQRGLPYHQTTSERDVFDFVRLPYLEPHRRP